MRIPLILTFCASLLSPLSLRAEPPLSEEEGHSLRRIADFWQEGEYQIAKSQMEEFLTLYPNSPYAKTLCLALGDLFLREKNYLLALEYYAKTDQADLPPQTFLNRMHCLYHLQWHASLADECEAYLAKSDAADPELRLQATYLLCIALYQQCLNASNDPETLDKLASRAKPHFDTLAQTELSGDIAEAHAHLCCLVKDFEGASAIYFNLAKQSPESDELLFQAALLQAKHDKDAALATFRSIEEKGGSHAKEAAYNQLILNFEQERYQQIADSKEILLKAIPDDRKGLAHLILGKSFLALKDFKKASAELNAFLDLASSTDSIRPALLHLMDAAYQSDDLTLLDESIARLRALDEKDAELPRALFSRAQILKKEQNIDAAQDQLDQLLASFSQFPDRPQACFELAHLAKNNQNWERCRTSSLLFLKEFPNHELAPFAWRYFASSSMEIAAIERLPSTEKREQLVADLKKMLQKGDFLTPIERADWTVLLAKTHYEMQQFDESIALLEPMMAQSFEFAQKANGEVVLGLCYRDGVHNEEKFTSWTERAIADEQTLLPVSQLRVSLFNSYLARAELQPALLERAAEHLRLAFEEGLEIQLPNLLWLADYAYTRAEKDPAYAPTAARLLAQFVERTKLKPDAIRSDTLYLETLFGQLAKLQSKIGDRSAAIAQFESLVAAYAAHPELTWSHEKEMRLLLGEGYLAQGLPEKAEEQFDAIETASPTKRNPFTAKATLLNARLKLAKLIQSGQKLTLAQATPIAARLKDLVLQKMLENEPIHLEAALDYIDLQMQLEGENKEKKHALLLRMKQDFQANDDLLAKDYHAARERLPAQNEIYQSYMQYVEAGILLTEAELCADEVKQKELQAKGKDLLIQLEGRNLGGPLLERMHR